jgi:hypothetical protein
MGNYLKLAAAAAIMIAGPTVALAKAPTSKAATRVARLGGHPNLNGIWQVMNTANWNLEPHDAKGSPVSPRLLGAIGAIPPGLGVVEGGAIPYKPEALKKRDENRAKAPTADPEAACYLPGIPRATYMSYPFQIIQAQDGDILMAYEYASANRVIQMKPVEVPPIDTWMGTSYGTWEGDTLKVVTLSQNGMTWLDRSGNFATGGATITERFKPIDADHMTYEVTIDDPATYTRPWKISMPLYRNIDPKAEILDFRCVPFSEELLYGDLLADKDKYPKK